MVKAKFNYKVKEEIYNRDGFCIICGRMGMDFHHCYYGIESNREKFRNRADQGVLLCRRCHSYSHACKSGSGIRQKCISYLNKLGKKNKLD